MRLLYATDVRTAAITCPLLRAEAERAPDSPWEYYRAEVDGVVVEVLLRVHLGRVRGGVTVRGGPIYWGTVEPRWEGRVLVVDGTGVVIPVPDDSRLRPQGETTC